MGTMKKADSIFIDPTGKSHLFQHQTDKLGDFYTWSDITGFQHCFLRDMDMSFELWVGEVVRGICIALEVAL